MKPPGFWWTPPGAAARLLRPAALVYGAIAGRRMSRPGERPPVPVVCIGNVTLGGSGKTPTAIYVAALLRGMGRKPAFLSRGYGGTLPGPVAVDPGRHGSADVGDEPLLLARHTLAIVSRDRPAGAALAVAEGADIIVMDDGLQNPSLTKSFVLAVFDGAVGIGNGLTFPAGPLRAPLGAQWPAINAVLVIGPGVPGDRIAAEALQRGLPVFRGALRPDPATAASLRGTRILAFAGIGRPDKFFETVRGIGAEVVETRSFPDHHRYGPDDFRMLQARAEAGKLTLVTTQKDEVRLSSWERESGRILTLPVELSLAEPAAFGRLLADRLYGR